MLIHSNLKSPSFHLSSFEIIQNISVNLGLDFQTHFGRPGGNHLESSETLVFVPAVPVGSCGASNKKTTQSSNGTQLELKDRNYR